MYMFYKGPRAHFDGPKSQRYHGSQHAVHNLEMLFSCNGGLFTSEIAGTGMITPHYVFAARVKFKSYSGVSDLF